ncbi:VirE-like protein [Larkinella arboricola]|uniref:VirE-like protein n=1 Tax=Larkinella arboricola TaxID=643671 RepID=A0A327X9G6_LARAB|nr:BT4734/BF3469 family protein [Larkinella arboricola]RAK02898.1 VirE-like protein [Larkinella arboricola]
MEPNALRPNLLDVPISFFEYDHQRNHFANTPSQETTLRRIVTTRFYRSTIEAIRSETDPIRQDQLKKQLPAITPVALLYHRRRETTFAQKIKQQWPMLMGDIDWKDNPGVDMAELKKHLTRLPYVLLCAYSVRGGLWFVVRLPDDQTPETLTAHFRYLQKVFLEKFGIVLDASKGGNPTHLRFVSYDAEPYLNENATVMKGIYTPSSKPTFRTNPARPTKPVDQHELVTRLVRFTQNAAEGQRHETLLKAAILAGGYVATGKLDESTAVYALETVASEWPNFSKSQKTIRDGIAYGLAKPIVEPQAPLHSSVAEVVQANNRIKDGYCTDETPEKLNPMITAQKNVRSEPVNSDRDFWQINFFEWQRTHPPFNQLGLVSLRRLGTENPNKN